MANSSILTNDFQVSQASLFVDSVGTQALPSYYAFLAEPVPTQTNAIPDIYDDTLENMVAPYRNMIVGKIITPSDVSLAVPNIPYAVNTAYAMYDDGNPLFFTTSYFAIVNAGAYYHVWKVLDNNMGATSQVAPNIADIDSTDEVYETSDGYRWKYMYSVTSTVAAQFSSANWFPLTVNNSVTAAAVPGAIDIIQIESAGQGYNNYLTGTFTASAITVTSNAQLYSVTDNSSANQLSGFYTGSIIYISSGTGEGGYQTIINSFSNANGSFVVVANALTITPQNGSTYEIYPEVVIYSAGNQTVNARARALINSSGNSIYLVEMLNRGANYQYITANVIANAVVGVVSQANVRPIYGPFGGHGANAAAELGATAVAVAVSFNNTESSTIPATNDYQQIGVIAAPLFQNVVANVTTNSLPLFDEQGYVLQTRFLTGNAVVTSIGNNIITSSNGTMDNFTARIEPGDMLYLTGGTVQQLVNVVSVANTSYMTVSQNALWSCTSTQVYLANLSSSFIFSGALTSNVWFLTNVVPQIATSDIIVFTTSGAEATITGLTRSGVTKDFSTFLGLYSYTSTSVTGTFQQNELVTQGSNSATLFAAISNSGTYNIYTSNQVGQFSNVSPNNTILGSNSGAVAVLSKIYEPEIVFGSGLVLYAENVDAISRNGSTNDNLVFVLEF